MKTVHKQLPFSTTSKKIKIDSKLGITSKRVKIRLTKVNEDLFFAGYRKGDIIYGVRLYVGGKKATPRVIFDPKEGDEEMEVYLGLNCELASHENEKV